MLMMNCLADFFPHSSVFDPAGDFEAFLKTVPARWVVYLLADEADRPVQLLCVKNLRNSLKRRLGVEEEVAPSKRVNYRELVRRVYWVRVDNALESDWIYLEAARACFPNHYGNMVGFRPAWFLHVNPDARFPRYVKTTDLDAIAGQYFGPMEDKTTASRLIEMLEDAFDLCRYFNILAQAPNGKACAYKEMGKCPAPCDGSIGLDQYRWLIEWSMRAITDPADLVRQQIARMQSAAKELRFEIAGKIKQYVDELGAMSKGPFRYVSRLEEMAFVSLQHGPSKGSASAYVILPGLIEPIATAFSEAGVSAELHATILRRAEHPPIPPIDRAGEERIAVLAAHLFATKNTRGVFLRLNEVSPKSLLLAYRDLQKQTQTEEGADDEGIVKELQPSVLG